MGISRNVLFCSVGFVCLFVFFLPHTVCLGLSRNRLCHHVRIYRKYEKSELCWTYYLFLSRLLWALNSEFSSCCRRVSYRYPACLIWIVSLEIEMKFYTWSEFARPLGVTSKADILITGPTDVVCHSWQCKLSKWQKLSEGGDWIHTSFMP